MKTLQLFLSLITGIISILFASSYVGFASAESTSILDSGMPPIIMTQVELWGPSSFHTDGVRSCENNETSLGPWAVGWVELHNTKNDSIAITDVDLQGKGWEEGQFPITLGPQEYCYIVTQNQLTTRIGVGGSLGNGSPPHDNATTILLYSVQSLDKKMNYTYSTPPLSDDLGDAKTWQLVDGNWIFLNANFRQDLSAKTIMLSPLKQFKSGIAANNVKCKQDLHLVIKAEDNSPACVKLDVAYMLIKRGWATSESAYPEGDAQFVLKTNSTIIPGHLPRHSGLVIPYQKSSRTLNYTGFDGVYNVTLMFRGTPQDYVLKPGNNGTITFEIDAKTSELPGQSYSTSIPKSLNLTNYAVFYHEITNIKDLSKYPGVTISNDYGFKTCFTRPGGGGTCQSGQFEGTSPIEAYVVDHPGVNVLFEPPFEALQLGPNTTSQVVTMMISVDDDALKGTYLVEIPDLGEFLLTVGNQPYHE